MAQKLSLPWATDLLTQLLNEARQRPVLGALAALGTLWATRQAFDLASFAYVHWLRRSSLSRYAGSGSNAAWALVTGASDGIGKGFAEELCQRGFNVILHGRNEAKLNRVKDELLKQCPQREIRILVIDAVNEARDSAKLEAAARSLEGLNLRVLVNNVGGNPLGGVTSTFTPLQDKTGNEVSGYFDINGIFPTEITRVVLPSLIRAQPALIINIGSGASELAAPYLSIYGAVKAYNRAWSRSMGAEMRLDGHDIEVLFILVGGCATSALPERSPGFFIPTGRQMARSSLDVVGCGRSAIWAYWPHALQFSAMLSLPGWLLERVGNNMLKNLKAEEMERLKHQ